MGMGAYGVIDPHCCVCSSTIQTYLQLQEMIRRTLSYCPATKEWSRVVMGSGLAKLGEDNGLHHSFLQIDAMGSL